MTKNRRSTKTALLSSVLALVLCCSMLLGTTFAWFTDSVTSANNVIMSGNLDVTLEYLDANGKWTDVQGTDEILDKEALWEPGYAEVAYFRLKNAGSLALKYQLGVNIVSETKGVNRKGEEFKLSDYIYFDVVEVDGAEDKVETFASRDKAIEAINAGKLISEGYTQADELAAKSDYVYLAMVVYMPTTVGDAANHNGTAPKIELGINVFATQTEAEKDSFDTDYDADAWHPEMKVYTANDLQAALNNAEAGDVIELMDNIDLTETLVIPAAPATYSMRSVPAPVVIDLNGKTISGSIHKNDGAIIKNEGSLILKNGTVSSIANNGGSALVNNGTAVLENVTLNGAPNADGSWPSYTLNNTGVLTATNVKFTSYHGSIASYNEGALVTLNDCEIDMVGIPGFTNHGIYTYSSGAVVVNGGTYVNRAADQNSTGGSVINGAVTVNGGTFSGRIENYYGTPVINGGSFSVSPKKFIANGFKAVEADGLFYVIPENVDTLITTPAQLAALGGTKISGTYYLAADLDMTGYEMQAIAVSGSTSELTFIGNGHTISNLTTVSANQNGMPVSALFNVNYSGKALTVSDLTFKNANVSCDDYSAVVVAYNSWGDCVITLNNVDVIGATVNGASAAGLIAYTTGVVNLTDCDVSGLSLTGEAGRPDKVGALVGTANTATCVVTATNCTNGTDYNDVGRVINGAKWNGGFPVFTTEALIEAIKNAPVGSETTIYLGNTTYAGDIAITVAALGKSGGDVVIKAMEGATPVIAGTVTLGYRNQGVGSAMYDANVTFEGITFDHADAAKHSICVQDVKSLTLKACKIVSDGEYGIDSARGNATGTSKIVGCTFENSAMQLLGNLATGLVIDDCTFNNSRINVQAGNGVTVQNCVFNNTLTAANVGDSFYAIRSNSTPITVKNCELNIDSELDEVATNQAKWYLLANRGATNWTVENVAVTLTDAALAQTELVITACTSTGVINTTNLTVNGVEQ